MIRAGIVSLTALTGLASASTVNFIAHELAGDRLVGVNTSAVLSADDTTFTITLHNRSDSGSMAAFYIQTGAALNGLSDGTITNGSGVLFSEHTPTGDIRSNTRAPGTPDAPLQASIGVFGSNPGDDAAAGSGLSDGWSGIFFGMAGRGDLGQATGEFVSITFRHDGSFSLDDLLASLASDDIRFFQLYNGMGEDGDERGYLSSSLVVVPLPPAAWAGLAMLGAMVGVRALKKHRRG